MYNKSVAIIGNTIEKTTKYDQFREDRIRMELYRIILSFYSEGYRTFNCYLHTYIGLLAADMIVILRETNKCPKIFISAVIPKTPYPVGEDKLYCTLYDDLIKQADSKEILSEKDNAGKVPSSCHIICYYNDFCPEIRQVRASGIPYTNIYKMI